MRYLIIFDAPGDTPDWDDAPPNVQLGAFGGNGEPLDERFTLNDVPTSSYPVTLVVEGPDARRAEAEALDRWGVRYVVVDSTMNPNANPDIDLDAIESYQTTDGGSVPFDELSSDDNIDHVDWSWTHACKAHGADKHGFVDETQDPYTGFYNSTRLVQR